MKRALALSMAALAVTGGLALAQCGCPPPAGPCCYTAFWAGEEVHFQLVLPFGMFCCCQERPGIVGWRVETMAGALVYQVAFPEPKDPTSLTMVWDQKDQAGDPVAPGYYKLVVTTVAGEHETYVRIAERPSCCFFWWWPWSRPCGASLCRPYIKVFRAPACPSGCAFTLFLGSGS
ncbi:MAG: DUF2271 domain-containing protein [Candidatus Acetothermia bacterium]|jgi:hypothetical protein|nr:DUF2271 domain-containing protein [Candidatus Acetothermia bacterium]